MGSHSLYSSAIVAPNGLHTPLSHRSSLMCCCGDAVDEDKLIIVQACCCSNVALYPSVCSAGVSGKAGILCCNAECCFKLGAPPLTCCCLGLKCENDGCSILNAQCQASETRADARTSQSQFAHKSGADAFRLVRAQVLCLVTSCALPCGNDEVPLAIAWYVARRSCAALPSQSATDDARSRSAFATASDSPCSRPKAAASVRRRSRSIRCRSSRAPAGRPTPSRWSVEARAVRLAQISRRGKRVACAWPLGTLAAVDRGVVGNVGAWPPHQAATRHATKQARLRGANEGERARVRRLRPFVPLYKSAFVWQSRGRLAACVFAGCERARAREGSGKRAGGSLSVCVCALVDVPGLARCGACVREARHIPLRVRTTPRPS